MYADEGIQEFLDLGRTTFPGEKLPSSEEVAHHLGVEPNYEEQIVVDVIDKHGDIYNDLGISREDVVRLLRKPWSALYSEALERLESGRRSPLTPNISLSHLPLSLRTLELT